MSFIKYILQKKTQRKKKLSQVISTKFDEICADFQVIDKNSTVFFAVVILVVCVFSLENAYTQNSFTRIGDNKSVFFSPAVITPRRPTPKMMRQYCEKSVWGKNNFDYDLFLISTSIKNELHEID